MKLGKRERERERKCLANQTKNPKNINTLSAIGI